MGTKILAAVGVLAAGLAAGAGDASAREWEASGGAAVHGLASPGVDAAATSDSVTLGELGFAVEVLRGLPFVDLVSAEVRWQAGSTSAEDFRAFETTLELDHLEAGVRAARDLHPHLRVFAHADLGGVRGRLSIRPLDTPGGRGLADSDWALLAGAGAGVDLALVARGPEDSHPDFALGLRLELGFQVTGALAFSARPTGGDAAAAPLTTVAAPLGDLDASGGVLRIGVFGRW